MDYWAWALGAKSSTIKMTSFLHKKNGWDCRHLDCVLALTQSPGDADVCLKIAIGHHVENNDDADMSSDCCLKLLSNCYGTKDAATNRHDVLSNSLIDRGFSQNTIDPCLFVRKDCIIVTCVDDCLILCKNDKVLKNLISSLEDDFRLTDEGDLETFLGVNFTQKNQDVLEIN